MVGRPGHPEEKKTEAEAADEAMNRLREQQEAQIIITTTDASKKPKPAIASLTLNLGNIRWEGAPRNGRWIILK